MWETKNTRMQPFFVCWVSCCSRCSPLLQKPVVGPACLQCRLRRTTTLVKNRPRANVENKVMSLAFPEAFSLEWCLQLTQIASRGAMLFVAPLSGPVATSLRWFSPWINDNNQEKKKDGSSVRKNPPLICQVSDMALASFLNLFRIPFVMTWGGGEEKRDD